MCAWLCRGKPIVVPRTSTHSQCYMSGVAIQSSIKKSNEIILIFLKRGEELCAPPCEAHMVETDQKHLPCGYNTKGLVHQANCSSHDDPADRNDEPTINYRNNLDQMESYVMDNTLGRMFSLYCDVCNYSNIEINTFIEKYCGVVNLSQNKITTNRLRDFRKRSKILSYSSEY